MMVFDGGLLDPADAASIVLPPDELRKWAWCTSGEASRRLSELLSRRVEAALRALATGATLYLENGAQIAG
jgi:hypothetical protein